MNFLLKKILFLAQCLDMIFADNVSDIVIERKKIMKKEYRIL